MSDREQLQKARDFLAALLDCKAADEAGDLLVNNGPDLQAELDAALKVGAPEYTYEHLEAAACMWEFVLNDLRRHRSHSDAYNDFREAYGMATLRATVIRHAPQLEAKYQEAVANGYDKDFDWEFVPQYMRDHVTRILTGS